MTDEDEIENTSICGSQMWLIQEESVKLSAHNIAENFDGSYEALSQNNHDAAVCVHNKIYI